MLKVTTLADGTQLQYLKVAHSLGPRWISHAESLLTTDRPERALGMLPGEAMSLYWRLVGLGYKGLSLTNALGVAQAGQKHDAAKPLKGFGSAGVLHHEAA